MKAAALLAGLSEKMDIPAEAIGSSLVSIVGKNMITIENHRGITDYTTDNVNILTSNGQIVIHGTEIIIKAMNRSTIIISGKFIGVELL